MSRFQWIIYYYNLLVNSLLIGVTLLSNFVTRFPLSSNKNLLKFQEIVASKTPFSLLLQSHL